MAAIISSLIISVSCFLACVCNCIIYTYLSDDYYDCIKPLKINYQVCLKAQSVDVYG